MYTLMKCNDVKRRQLIKSQTVCTLFHETVLYFLVILKSGVLMFYFISFDHYTPFPILMLQTNVPVFLYTIAEWLL